MTTSIPISVGLSDRAFSQNTSSNLFSPPVIPTADWLYTGLAVPRPIRRLQLSEERMAPYIDATRDACRKITVKALISVEGYRLQTIARAIAAAEDGCKLCRMIVDGIRPWRGRIPDAEMIVMRVANASSTPYCQDEFIVKSERLSNYNFTEEPYVEIGSLLGIYTDEGNFIPLVC